MFKKDILKITKILTSKGADVYVVGGSVRNSYWQEEFDNIDFSISISPNEVKELFKNIKCTIIETGIEYGTLSVVFNKNYLRLQVLEKILKPLEEKLSLNIQVV